MKVLKRALIFLANFCSMSAKKFWNFSRIIFLVIASHFAITMILSWKILWASSGFLLFSISSQLVLYNSCLKLLIVSLVIIILVICVVLFTSLAVDASSRKQKGKWPAKSVLKIIYKNYYKFYYLQVSTKRFVKIWSIIVYVFLVGFFIVGIKIFW